MVSAKCLLVLSDVESKFMKNKALAAIYHTLRQPVPSPTPSLHCPFSAWALAGNWAPVSAHLLSFFSASYSGVGNSLGKQVTRREGRTSLRLHQSNKEMDHQSLTQANQQKEYSAPESCYQGNQVSPSLAWVTENRFKGLGRWFTQ